MLHGCRVDSDLDRRIITYYPNRGNLLTRLMLARLLIFCAAVVAAQAPSIAQNCAAFRPTRLDTRNINLVRPVVVLPAHFNNDGLLDVTVVNKYAPGTLLVGSVSVLAGQFDGQFTLSSNQPTSGGTNWAAVSDLDDDRHPDIVTVNDDYITIFMGDGAGGFIPKTPIPAGFNSVYV